MCERGLPGGRHFTYTCIAILFLLLFFCSSLFCQPAKQPILSAAPKENLYVLFSNGRQATDTIWLNGTKSTRTYHAEAILLQRQITGEPKPAPLKKKDNPVQSLGGTLTIQTQATNSTCEGGDGSIIASVSGGTPPYQFSMNGGDYQSSGAYFYLSGNTYTILVKDANGLTASTTLTLTNAYPASTGRMSGYSQPSDCSTPDGSVTLTPISGTPPFTYSMDLTNFQNSNVFSNLPQSWFTYFIKDANGCIGSINGAALYRCNLTLGYDHSVGVCHNKGNLIISGVTGGTPPYQYSMDGIHYQNENEFNESVPGINKFYIKDADNNIAIYAFQVYEWCQVAVTAAVTSSPCGDNSGTLTATAENGTPPYQYSIDGTTYQAGNRFGNLPPGNYTVLAKDAGGMVGTTYITITSSCLTLTATPANATCNGNDGSIQATASGGTAPYQYSIDGVHFQDNGLFTMVKKGTYTVTVTDAGGATVSRENVAIKNSEGPLIDKATPTPSSCNTADGTLTIEASGGLSPLLYSLDGINYQLSNRFAGLGSGNYDAVVKDANGCKNDVCCYTVLYNCITATAAAANATCGLKNGSATIAANGGTGPYQYSADGAQYQNSNLFANLAAGDYTFYIKDNDGLSATVAVTVEQVCIAVQTAVTGATCNKDNGSLSATASGGAAPYQYSTDGIRYQAAGLFTDLPAGDYTVSVKDANGIVQTAAVSLTDFPPPQVTATATAATCADHDGSITVAAAKGTPPYLYRLDTEGEQTTGLFLNADAGVHTVAVRDANGCTGTATVTVPINHTLQADAGPDITLCEGSQAPLQATSNAASLRWEPAEGLDDPAALSPAASPTTTTKYYLRATTPLCTATDSVTVTVNKAPVADAGADVSVCYGKPVALAGGGGTSYAWQPAAYLSNASAPQPTVTCPAGRYTYILSVADDRGCRSLHGDTVVVFVTPPATVFAGHDTAVIRGAPFQLQATDIRHSGFSTYEWTPVTGLTDAGTANPRAIVSQDIRYTVTAYTADGCAGTDDILVKAYAGPDIYVPSAFSPNGDGRNDVVRAIPIGIVSFQYFAIYDRFGKRVFYTTQPERGWDGTINATAQNAGAYVWMTAGMDVNHHLIERKGTLVLVK